MGISVQRTGIVGCTALVNSIIADMVLAGFEVKHNSGATATLEASVTVDPLAATQPWRIRIEASTDLSVNVNVATPIQLLDNGTVSALAPAGNGTAGMLSERDGSLSWIERSTSSITAANQASYPMSYRITTSAHGFALFVWDEAADALGNRFSWVSVQRAVDSITGAPYVTGKSPVYCVFSYSDGLKKLVVREADILKPTLAVSADTNTEDSRAILNSEPQVSITEDNKYIITFPNGLNTPRCAYTHELDVIATTSADVVAEWAEVPITVYGESTPRVYKAMGANKPNNTGMRVMMLMDGPSTVSQ